MSTLLIALSWECCRFPCLSSFRQFQFCLFESPPPSPFFHNYYSIFFPPCLSARENPLLCFFVPCLAISLSDSGSIYLCRHASCSMAWFAPSYVTWKFDFPSGQVGRRPFVWFLFRFLAAHTFPLASLLGITRIFFFQHGRGCPALLGLHPKYLSDECRSFPAPSPHAGFVALPVPTAFVSPGFHLLSLSRSHDRAFASFAPVAAHSFRCLGCPRPSPPFSISSCCLRGFAYFVGAFHVSLFSA